MPEFLPRPNLPSELANTLVQLASQEVNPLAEAFKAIGTIGEGYAKGLLSNIMEEKKFERDLKLRAAEHEAKGRDMQADLIKDLIAKDYKIIPDKERLREAGKDEDFQGLMLDSVPGQEGYTAKDFPGVLKKGVRAVPREAKDADRFVTVGDREIALNPDLELIRGEKLSTASLLSGIAAVRKARDTMNTDVWEKAKALAIEDPAFKALLMEGNPAKVKAALEQYKRMVVDSGGGAADLKATPRKDLGAIVREGLKGLFPKEGK